MMKQSNEATRQIAEATGRQGTRSKEQGVRSGEQRLFTLARMRAFTLTELLTVIAIIAILMGLLFAFYRPSQEQRKVFECQNRLQVIHRALRLYMLDWDGLPASPYDSLNDDVVSDNYFDEDPTDRQDNDRDGKIDEDEVDAKVGGLLALDQYLRSRRTLICPADHRAYGGIPDNYTSYQGCDTGTDFYPPSFPITSSQQGICAQANGAPTYAITRFLPSDPCHPSNMIANEIDKSRGLTPPFPDCNDPDRKHQLATRNISLYFPIPEMPSDDTVVTWCVHHRFAPNTTTPNYVKGGEPADIVLYWDGSVRIQQMRTPLFNWRRKPTDQ